MYEGGQQIILHKKKKQRKTLSPEASMDLDPWMMRRKDYPATNNSLERYSMKNGKQNLKRI